MAVTDELPQNVAYAQRFREAGMTPPFSLEGFSDLEQDVRHLVARIERSPFIENKDSVGGFVYDVATGRLHQVADA